MKLNTGNIMKNDLNIIRTKAKEPNLTNYLPIAVDQTDGLIPFSRALVQIPISETRSFFSEEQLV